jgi:hypothetical protein
VNIQGLLNIIRRECQRVLAQRPTTRMGIVDTYDPALYCAKVRLQPEDPDHPERSLTGFLPIASEWVGNGWGLVCPPTAGDVVDVHFQEGGKNAGYISKRFFSSVTLPPMVSSAGAPSGEFWLVHQSGSFLKFTNDGKVTINSASDMDFISAGKIIMQAASDISLSAGGAAILHGANEAIIDAGGTGVKYTPSFITSYTVGVPGAGVSPSPPAIPE